MSIAFAVVAVASPAEPMPNSAPPIPEGATPAQFKQVADLVRAGKALTPKSWKNGARVAVCLSFDVDNELFFRDNPAPGPLSLGEYGATTALPRILALLDRQDIPASFYIPVGAAILHPEMIPEILKSGRHEIGIHGWGHEYAPTLPSSEEEERLLKQSVDYLTKASGRRPAGIRISFGAHTLQILEKIGFLYDTSLQAMDQPYQPLSNGTPSNLIEVPTQWTLDDYAYFGIGSWPAPSALPDPEAVFRIYRSEFDVAYEERTLFVVVMHPPIIGQRSRLIELEKFIRYIKSKPGVWFATEEEVARYVKANESR
jgi:peptidoglycan/xylan/chitin deacetylase (PgdA/CDA1 family)